MNENQNQKESSPASHQEERKLIVRTPHPNHGDEIREMTEDEIRLEVEDGELLIDEDTEELIQKDDIPESTKKIRRQQKAAGG